MKRIPFLLGIAFYLIYKLIAYLTGEVWLPLLVFLIPVGILVLSFVWRKSLKRKSWFLSPVNFLFERDHYSFQSDISNDLLFDKLIEVVEDSEFKLFDSDRDKRSILCGSYLNFWTWGENIYITLEEKEGEGTTIRFTSCTLYGNVSWNRNEKNYQTFITSFEESLII